MQFANSNVFKTGTEVRAMSPLKITVFFELRILGWTVHENVHRSPPGRGERVLAGAAVVVRRAPLGIDHALATESV